ncbi:MAG: SUMF1/EgtB/PvdO family nonheme iron enzyme [Candidatus Sumerlaeia bacterium]|nr:SUMF1/EgtB/PvdO family nonheme iron enzyme [Candidatus Sumerlaeia bacterium]
MSQRDGGASPRAADRPASSMYDNAGVTVRATTANGTTDSVSPWGCYDMSGNVAEWVFEQPYNYEQEGSETKGTSLTSRIIRGGSWQDVANDVRTAFRDSLPQDSTEPTVGFRIVRQSFDCGPEKK